jgi:hypothetical protein
MGKLFLVFSLGISLVYLPVAAQEDSGPALNTPKLKSEALAFSLSFYGTLLPILCSLALSDVRWGLIGSFIGPSLGYFYAGLWGRALLGIGVRTLAGAVCAAGISMVMSSAFVFTGSRTGNGGNGMGSLGALLALGGAILYVGSSLRDISSVKSAVWDHNKRLQEKKFCLAPFYIPSSKTIGIQVQFSF